MNKDQEKKVLILCEELAKTGVDPVVFLHRFMSESRDFATRARTKKCSWCNEQNNCSIRKEALTLIQSNHLKVNYENSNQLDHELFSIFATFCENYKVIDDPLFTKE